MKILLSLLFLAALAPAARAQSAQGANDAAIGIDAQMQIFNESRYAQYNQNPFVQFSVSPFQPSLRLREIEIMNFKGGRNSKYTSHLLPPGQVRELQNAFVDYDGAVVKRQGYTAYNGSPCGGASAAIEGLWPFYATDGTQYLISEFAIGGVGYLCQSNGGGTFAQFGGTVSATADMYATSSMGAIWFANGVDPLHSWDGVTYSTITTAPLFNRIGTYQNRLVGLNAPGAASTFFLSGYNDGTNWTTPATVRDTNPVTWPIQGLNDGQVGQCLIGPYHGNIYIGKNESLFVFNGYGNDTFQLRQISDHVGCTDQSSVVEMGGMMYWLSERGIEEFDGSTFHLISWPVQDLIQGIITNATVNQKFTIFAQSDWSAGTTTASGSLNLLSTTRLPGALTVSTFTFTESVSTWSASGTKVSVSTTLVSIGNVYQLSLDNDKTNMSLVTNGNFSSASFPLGAANGAWPNWTQINTAGGGTYSGFSYASNFAFQGVTSNIAIVEASQCLEGTNCSSICGPTACWTNQCVKTYQARILDQNSNVLLTDDWSASSSAWHHQRDVLTVVSTQNVTGVLFQERTSCGGTIVSLTSTVQPVPSSTTFAVEYNVYIDTTGGNLYLAGLLQSGFQLCQWKGSQYMDGCMAVSSITISGFAASGNFTSQPYSAGFNMFVGSFTVVMSSAADATSLFKIQTATSTNGIWSAGSTVLPGGLTTGEDLLDHSYARWHVDFTSTVSSKTPTIQSVTFNAVSSGTYLSIVKQITPIQQWGYFFGTDNSSILEGNEITYALGLSTTNASPASYTTIPNATVVPLGLNNYAAEQITLIPTDGSQVPVVNSTQLNWVVKAGRPRVASASYFSPLHTAQYWLAFTTQTTANAPNDTVLVWDHANAASLLKGINAASMAIYNRQLYTGDSAASGTVFLQESSGTDNGTPIDFKLKTADLVLTQAHEYKEMKRMFVDLEPYTVAGSSVNFRYYVDRDTTPYNLAGVSLLEDRSFITAEIPFPVDNYVQQIRTVAIEVENNQANVPVKLYRLWIEFDPWQLP